MSPHPLSGLPRPPFPARRAPARPRGPVLGVIVALHAALAWGLWHLSPWRLPALDPVPLMVTLEPGRPAPAPDTRALPGAPALPPPPVPAWVPPPVQIQEEASPAPAPTTAPITALTARATDPPPASPSHGPALPEAPAAVSPPTPVSIPPAAIQYRVLPDVVYPPASRRLGEVGLVIVAVWVGEDGEPREVRIAQSSGHERLDRAALAGVRRARFQPWTVDGRARAGWARIPIPFELER